MNHLWVPLKPTKIRCQRCEEIVTFAYSEYTYEYIATDKSDTCRGIPGPRPDLLYRNLVEEY